jgi:hypothetical protein
MNKTNKGSGVVRIRSSAVKSQKLGRNWGRESGVNYRPLKESSNAEMVAIIRPKLVPGTLYTLYGHVS